MKTSSVLQHISSASTCTLENAQENANERETETEKGESGVRVCVCV